MNPETFTAFLHHNIPLTTAVGVAVARCGEGEIEIRAPLAPNLNHHGTAFGGSLALLAVVGGWSLMHQELTAAGFNAQLVVGKSESEFLKPGTGELIVTSRLPESGWDDFAEALRRKGRGKLTVTTTIVTGNVVVLKNVGVYAALVHK